MNPLTKCIKCQGPVTKLRTERGNYYLEDKGLRHHKTTVKCNQCLKEYGVISK